MKFAKTDITCDKSSLMYICLAKVFFLYVVLALSNFCPPFFATTKAPSMKHSSKLINPLSSRCRARASRIFLSLPSFTHLLNACNRWMTITICQAAPSMRLLCADPRESRSALAISMNLRTPRACALFLKKRHQGCPLFVC